MSIAEWIETAKSLFGGGGGAAALTQTQALFELWQAERLGISLGESHRRYARSRRAFLGGHRGRAYRRYNDLSYELMQVFYDDTASEAMSAYHHHAPMHFLMMLGYPEPAWSERSPLVAQLGSRARVSILDFGCGLAHKSRTLATYLKSRGVAVELHLADIPTLRAEFLGWVLRRTQVAGGMLACTPAEPIPALPAFDVLIATEFFEHVHDPVTYFDRFDARLSPGGVMLTQVDDHHAEFMHVSPSLGELRREIAERGYEALVPNVLYRKPGPARVEIVDFQAPIARRIRACISDGWRSRAR
jgi:cyclopropane fatty-acyl-phospholipid synthase-like methyltransferase